jgi:hypothetical protein
MWKEAVMDYFEVTFQHWLRRPEEIHERSKSIEKGFQTWISRI